MNQKKVVISLFVIPILALILAYCGSQYGQFYNDLPVFGICVGVSFLINWIAFIPAYMFQTERFFDLTGSLTYITLVAIALYMTNDFDQRTILLAALVIIWAVRLGSFLFVRIMQDGKDDRFDSIKPNFLRFFNTWSIQALWVVFTALAALIAITSETKKELDALAYVGLAIWILGFLVEVVADQQKRKFKKDPANKGKFIKTGLWAKSRHPNYFGEILLWTGIFIIAIPVLNGAQWIALLSPVFVYLLLTKVSGIPMLEAKSDKKWGGQEDYEKYKAETPVLIPKL